MIKGVVSADREATIPLIVRSPDGDEVEIAAVIDTGFTGWISLPSALITELELPWRRRGQGELADGSEIIFDIYEATVDWGGDVRRVWVDEMNADPLLGMSLLEGYELTVQVWSGGKVTITAK